MLSELAEKLNIRCSSELPPKTGAQLAPIGAAPLSTCLFSEWPMEKRAEAEYKACKTPHAENGTQDALQAHANRACAGTAPSVQDRVCKHASQQHSLMLGALPSSPHVPPVMSLIPLYILDCAAAPALSLVPERAQRSR